jgi:hypothetical protein
MIFVKKISSWKKLPLGVCILISLGLHTIALFLPVQTDQKIAAPELTPIQVIRLFPSPSPSSSISPSPQSLPKFPPQPSIAPTSQAPLQPFPQPLIKPIAPLALQPAAVPSATPIDPIPSISPSVSPSISPSSSEDVTPPGVASSEIPLADSNLQSVAASRQADSAVNQVMKKLSQLGATRIDVPEFYFPQPELFFAPFAQDPATYDMEKPLPGFDGNFVVVLDKTPEQLFLEFFTENLGSHDFNVSQLPNYGGGLLYEMKQGDFTRYLNLIPTQDGTGTLVVFWNRLPS